MIKNKNSKRFDLEERTYKFTMAARRFIKKIPKTLANIEDPKQLIKSSGSVGANYIEANEALSRKDFVHRVKICRKEAKESIYWLKLLDLNDDIILKKEKQELIQEATELMRIFGSMVFKLDK
jgi:four helix bundle protein